MMKLGNYMISAGRNILKHKLFSAINIFGLAAGFATCILIMLFVKDELSFDNWIINNDRIFRLELISHPPSTKTFELAATMGPLKPFIDADFPEVEETARLTYQDRNIQKDNDYFSENVAFVDNNFFQIFGMSFLKGSVGAALKDPASVVISEKMALKYFGSTDAIGKELIFSNNHRYRVTAIFADLPRTTHFNLDIAIPLSYSEFPKNDERPSLLDDWFEIGTYIYVKLKSDITADSISNRFPEFLDRRGPRPNDQIVPSKRWNLKLVPLTDIHLKGSPTARIKPKGSMTTIVSFLLIAVMILIIACFNFMNLSTARASLRAKEVALRKVLGAQKKDIIFQFLSEAILMAFVAFLLAMVMVEIILPYYNVLIDKVMEIGALHSPITLASLIILTFIVALGAGAHPAFIMSGFRPSRILAAGRSEPVGSLKFRTFLVIAQFTICISLIVCALVVYSQLTYSFNRDAGFDKENLLVLDHINDPLVMGKAQILKNRLLELPEIKQATLSSVVPADRMVALIGFSDVDGRKSDPILLRIESIDPDYLSTYGIKLDKGRNLSPERGDDIARLYGEPQKNGNILINESAVTKLGFKGADDALGKQLIDEVAYTIVGVIPDLYLQTTRETTNPTFYYIDQEFYNKLTIKYSTQNIDTLVNDINDIWRELFPQVPMSQIFLDEKIMEQYKADQEQGRLFLIFASLAIVISSLGLYGLASFTAERRIKEIGIRKVMGASVFDVVRLLVWQFSKPVILANLIAWPFSFYFMVKWLEGFSYRIDNIFVIAFCFIAGIGALLIAWITVASNSIRVARSNPINALRYE
ncbi:MAG: ABC transporter permease [Kordiimonadaceae bacterium]|nr:ABC transporter permease [Kordiimonadaceae bacterium]